MGISGDTLVVGARNHDEAGITDVGAAYVFARSGNGWVEEKKLTAPNGAQTDRFGQTVAIEDDTVVVAAPDDNHDMPNNLTNAGTLFVFVRENGVWAQQAELIASDAIEDAQLGYSLAISGGTLVAGAIDNNTGSGAAYVFVREAGNWSQQAKLVADQPQAESGFGSAVAIEGDDVVVGAPLFNNGAVLDTGAAFVYQRVGTDWSQVGFLQAVGGLEGDGFGYAVSKRAEAILVGSPFVDTAFGIDAGKVIAFERVGTLWDVQAELLPSMGEAGDEFGAALVLHEGNTALIGARENNQTASNAGAVFVIDGALSNGDPCSSPGECFSGFCVDGVCCDTACGDGSTTDCQTCAASQGAPADGTCGAVSAGTTCRDSQGDCDAVETCDGAALECPTDSKLEAGSECRASAGECDAAEVCSGTEDTCPEDKPAADGETCSDGVCESGQCVPSGTGGGGGGPGGDSGGCGCRVEKEGPSGLGLEALVGLCAVGMFGIRRRGRRSAPKEKQNSNSQQ